MLFLFDSRVSGYWFCGWNCKVVLVGLVMTSAFDDVGLIVSLYFWTTSLKILVIIAAVFGSCMSVLLDSHDSEGFSNYSSSGLF